MTAPPHDPQAELEVIGLALDNGHNYTLPDLTAEDFHVPAHQQLWDQAVNAPRPIRPADIPEPLRPIARNAVTAWTAGTPTRGVARVRACAQARRAITAAAELDRAARNVDLDAAYDIAHRVVADLGAL